MHDILHAYATWLHQFAPLWAFYAVATFIPFVAVFMMLFTWRRITVHRRGEKMTKRKTTAAEYVMMAVTLIALFYARQHYPQAAEILNWPERTFPLYRHHAGAMWLGFGAATYTALGLSAMFAALYIRIFGRNNAAGPGGALPFPAGWEGWSIERSYNRSEWEE